MTRPFDISDITTIPAPKTPLEYAVSTLRANLADAQRRRAGIDDGDQSPVACYVRGTVDSQIDCYTHALHLIEPALREEEMQEGDEK